MIRRPQKRMSIPSRMAIKLVLLSTFSLSIAGMLNLMPSPKRAELRRRATICEFLAITSSLLAQNRQDNLIRKNFAATVSRFPEIQSACIRRSNGSILEQFGDHQNLWKLDPDESSNRDNIFVPIKSGSKEWGKVELCFEPQQGIGAMLADTPIIPLGIFTFAVNWLFFRWFLMKAFKYLDPTRSVPTHVRSTLDTFSEGVVVLDNDQRIVLANDKFKQHVDMTDQQLLGRAIEDLPWLGTENLPKHRWEGKDESTEGMKLELERDKERCTFLVNVSAIMTTDGKRKGVIASFDDITPLERKREELTKMLAELKSSRDQLTKRNKQLQYLATRDSLTGCLNRRTFFEIFDKHWASAGRHGSHLSCFMLDVDHFKSVNDNHGHSMGDEVLRKVSKTLRESIRESDVVCRYGGEEFCILLPETGTEQARELAEEIRIAISELEFENFSVTASFGVSSINKHTADPQELLDLADQCLYIAKRNGRNQVVRWDQVPDEELTEESTNERTVSPIEEGDENASIPYPAVASLLSALAYRDANTAAHSTRVAELCVATASGLLSVKDTYVLEVAALLHDIGKIGVPDAILLKPGPLTEEEWETMELHDRIGVEIIEASFSNQQLVDIVRFHHATYQPNDQNPHLPSGEDIPIAARIVTIADAYDAMVSDRVYRKGRSAEEAFAELRRCAGKQFDPDLVERFIGVVKDYTSITLPIASKQIALQVGLQIERLADAIDNRDSGAIKALASRLESTAALGGITEIEDMASEIKNAGEEDSDMMTLLQMVDQLMCLCRSAQKVYADTRFTDENEPPEIPQLVLATQSNPNNIGNQS